MRLPVLEPAPPKTGRPAKDRPKSGTPEGPRHQANLDRFERMIRSVQEAPGYSRALSLRSR